MSIKLNSDDMRDTLEEAVLVARSKARLPSLWVKRVESLGQLGILAYIPALGGVLLAKATDTSVDSFCQDADAGPRGYSLRVVAELLQAENKGRYDLGSRSPNPMNSSPFMRGPGRLDDITKIARGARPSYELFIDCVRDASKLSEAEAKQALAAFLRVRMAVAAAKSAQQRQDVTAPEGMTTDALLRLAEVFTSKHVEGGRTGQALVASVLDCVTANVELLHINAPHPGDVRVKLGGKTSLMVEVKQVPVDESVALKLAQDTKKAGATSALLVVLAIKHRPLDRERLRSRAMKQFGVAVEVCESIRELVGSMAVFNGGRLAALRDRLPEKFAARMDEIGVSPEAQTRWRDDLQARSRS